MNQKVNVQYKDLYIRKPRYFILMGGRGGGRSTAASQFGIAKLTAPGYFRCAIMRLILSDIRNSIFQDMRDRVEEQGLVDTINVRENPIMTLRYGKNRIDGIAFRKSSSDQKSKLKSLANYNCIIIEEADEIPEEDFNQLDDSIRTIKSDITIILLLNPPNKDHWIIRRWFNLIPVEGVEGFYMPVLKERAKHNTVFISTDYTKNRANLNETTIANFESYKENNPEHYYNMIKGYVSEGARGRIFKNWKPISEKEYEELPFASIYGLDFGFSNDSAALVEVKIHNNKIYVRELFYELGLTNPLISKRMSQLSVSKGSRIYADSQEPKSIVEIGNDGWNIVPSTKGQDSIRAGVNKLLGMEVFYTESSENLITEIENYKWALDRNKNPTNEPVDEYNHLMDAIRYAVFTHLSTPQPDVYLG